MLSMSNLNYKRAVNEISSNLKPLDPDEESKRVLAVSPNANGIGAR